MHDWASSIMSHTHAARNATYHFLIVNGAIRCFLAYVVKLVRVLQCYGIEFWQAYGVLAAMTVFGFRNSAKPICF